MEQLMLEQFMKLSEQIGEIKTNMNFRFEKLESEMHAGFKAHNEKISSLESEMHEKFDSLESEMRAGFKAHDEKIASLESEMRDCFKQQSMKTDKLQKTLEENTRDTAEIFHYIFKGLGENEKKIINLSR